MIDRVCIECKRHFYVWPATLKSRPALFCSKVCRNINITKVHDYGYDIDFLNKNDELSAYFLGLFVTDGHLGNKSRWVSIALTDRQLIYDLAKRLNYKRKIGVLKVKGNRKEKHRLGFGGPIVDQLVSYGFPRGVKTGKEFIPSCISDQLFPHFLRGVIDGDGCIYILPNGKLSIAISCASRQFLLELQYNINRLYGNKVIGSLYPTQHIFVLRYATKDSMLIGDLIYKEATIKLERKYDKFIIGNSRGMYKPYKYEAKSVCKVLNCSNRPYAKNLCTNHYMNMLYRKKHNISPRQYKEAP